MADSKKKHVVVRSQHAPLADFDEQWWPVTLLLLISAGCLAGYVWLSSDFNSPKLLSNGWLHLGLIAILVIALVAGVAILKGSAQRRLQLGIFLSLALHVALLFFGQRVYMSVAVRPLTSEEAVIDDENDVVVSIPDYLPKNDQSQTSDPLTRPAETEIRNEPKTEVTPQLPAPVETKKESVQEPEPTRDPQQAPLELAKVELTAPRRNEILSGADLSRKDLPDQLPTDVVPDRQINRASQPELAMNAPTVEADRQTPSDSPTRRPKSAETPLQDRPKPDLAPFAPMQRPQEEQTASVDVRAQLNRPMSEAALPQMNAPAAAGAAPRTAAEAPSAPQPTAFATTDMRQTSTAAPTGSPSQAAAPQVTFTPNAATSTELQRAETTDASPSAVASLTPRQPSRIAAGSAGAGVESVPLAAPSTSAATNTTNPGGATLDATATGVRRGNQGTPQLTTGDGPSLPAPIGAGSGATVGGTTVGPRSDLAQGDGGAGVAAAATVVGRPGRGRAAGPASAPLASVPSASIAGVPGTTNVAGNASTGSASALQPSASAAGVARGSANSAGGIVGPAQPQSGSAVAGVSGSNGAASGTMSGNSGGATAAIARAGEGDTAGSAAAVGRSNVAKLSPGNASVALPGLGTVAVPTTSPAADSTNRGEGENTPAVAAGAVGIRREATGLPVMISAPEGPGGLTARVSPDVGLPSRRARPESEVAHLEMNRLIPERIGGKISGGGQVRDTAVVGLKQRDPTGRGEVARAMGGSEATEQAVERGLDFLARHQSPDGSWELHNFGQGRREYAAAGLASMEANTAGTGLALLAFLGAGYTHSDGKYAPVVEKGLGYLLKHQKADGDLFVPPRRGASEANTWFYSHGIASIALCEALGMSRDDELLKDPAQKAIDFIVASQNPELGGWRYLPRIGSDTSVSGWQLMALKSAERVGLTVPPQCYQLVTKWLDFAQGVNGDPTRYAYMPQSDQEHQRVVSRVMTAEALLMRQYLGWNRNHPNLTGGADFLITQLPTIGDTSDPQRDSYYWYYATQVMFHMKGEHWQRWNEKLRPILVDTQVPDGPLGGSWDPGGDIPDRWAAPGGRVYVTAMHLLMLEVYYRYLPLYQNLEE